MFSEPCRRWATGDLKDNAKGSFPPVPAVCLKAWAIFACTSLPLKTECCGPSHRGSGSAAGAGVGTEQRNRSPDVKEPELQLLLCSH